MRRRLKWILLLASASGAAAFAVVLGGDMRVASRAREAFAPDSSASARVEAPPASLGAPGAQLPARPALGAAGPDPFATAAMAAPPAPVARGAAPPAAAPPLPYRFAGRVYQQGQTEVYIARDNKVIAVKKGDVVDGAYRVDAVGGTELAFTHLPSGTRQVMKLTPPLEDGSRSEMLTLERRAQSAPAMLE